MPICFCPQSHKRWDGRAARGLVDTAFATECPPERVECASGSTSRRLLRRAAARGETAATDEYWGSGWLWGRESGVVSVNQQLSGSSSSSSGQTTPRQQQPKQRQPAQRVAVATACSLTALPGSLGDKWCARGTGGSVWTPCCAWWSAAGAAANLLRVLRVAMASPSATMTCSRPVSCQLLGGAARDFIAQRLQHWTTCLVCVRQAPQASAAVAR
jgi:hypothetical protein